MSSEDQTTSGQFLSEDVQVLTGNQIWIENPKDCHTLQRICLLPGAWNLFSQISLSKRRIDDFYYLLDDTSLDPTCSGSMTKDRKYAILFAATLLCGRKLPATLGSPRIVPKDSPS